MNPYDEKQPEEQDPEFEELITLLQHANLDPMVVDPAQRSRILSRTRAHLMQTTSETSLDEVGVVMSSQRNPFQKNKFLFFLLIGLFLSVCLALLINSISLPSWLRPLVPVFLIALIALLILEEALKEDTPTHPLSRIPSHEKETPTHPQFRKITLEEDTPPSPERRAFLKRFIVPAGLIALLTIVGGFLTIKEANVEQEQQAFDAQRKSQLTRLRIGFLPIGNDPGGVLPTNAFDDALSKDLNDIPVTSASVGATYSDTVKALGEGDIEMAWLGPLSYLYAHQKYGAKVILLRLTPAGQKTYQSYFITRKDSGIHTLRNLKGQRFAFADTFSTSGNLIPRYELTQAGLDPDHDITGIYVGPQKDVIDQVLNGSFPAGAVSSDNYNSYLQEFGQKASDLTILFKSPVNIPEGPIAVRQDIQPYDRLHIEDALLIIGEESPTVLNSVNIGGFAKATDSTYAELLSIVQSMHIDLSTYNG